MLSSVTLQRNHLYKVNSILGSFVGKHSSITRSYSQQPSTSIDLARQNQLVNSVNTPSILKGESSHSIFDATSALRNFSAEISSHHPSSTPNLLSEDALIEQVQYISKKSDLDNREYCSFVLKKNGLQVLCISDPESTEASCAMDVRCGYFQDPKETAGLLHFLEHMLFLGTERYPDEKSYKHFLSQHGGGSNASTAAEHTNYYFSVNANFLAEALDRFAAFFICPLFTPSATEREMQAVDSEFRRNLQNEGRRILQVLKHTSNENHPYTKFSTGSLETLGKLEIDQVRNILLEKFRQYYTADNMKFVIYGKESISALKQMALEKCSDIPSSPLYGVTQKEFISSQLQQLNYSQPLFLDHQIGKLHKIAPIKDIRSMALYWELPPQINAYETKRLTFLTHLLEQQSKGSLYDTLISKNWINGLDAGLYSSTSLVALYKVTFSLTELGMKHVNEICSYFFEALTVVKNSLLDQNEAQLIFEELANVFQISFKTLEKGGVSSYASEMAYRLHHYPVSDLLFYPYKFGAFNSKTILETLQLFSPQTMRMYLVAKQFEKESNLSVEPIYGTSFAEESISKEMIQQWSSILQQPSQNLSIQLPPRNPFVASDFSIVEKTNQFKNPMILTWDGSDTSVKHCLWFHESQFKVPFATVSTSVKCSADFVTSLRDGFLLQFYLALVSQSLSDVSYQAGLADLSFSVSYQDMQGIDISFDGYSDKLEHLMEIVYSKLMQPEWCEQTFERSKNNMKRFFENQSKAPSMDQAFSLRRFLLSEPYYHHSRCIKVLETIELGHVKEFGKIVWKELSVETFISGNISQERAIQMKQKIDQLLQHSALPNHHISEGTRSLSLPPQCNAICAQVTTNPQDINNAVILHYALGSRNQKSKVLMELLSSIIKPQFFAEIRTKQQLGYSVHSSSVVYEECLAFEFSVTAPNHDAGDVLQRILKFITDFSQVLQNITVEEFTKYKTALKEIKAKPFKKLAEEASWHHSEISSSRYEWNRLREEIEWVDGISFEELNQFFKEHFITESKRRLAVLVFANADKFANFKQNFKELSDGAEWIEDVALFKSKLPTYPLLKKSKSVLKSKL